MYMPVGYEVLIKIICMKDYNQIQNNNYGMYFYQKFGLIKNGFPKYFSFCSSKRGKL